MHKIISLLLVVTSSFMLGRIYTVAEEERKITPLLQEASEKASQLVELSAKIRARHQECVQKNSELHRQLWDLRHRKPR